MRPQEEDTLIEEPPRAYLGMSELGHECPCYLWYSFRWVLQRKITQQQKRLFSRGHNEEPIVIRDLLSWGYSLVEEQSEYTAAEGHIQGHSDAKLKTPLNDYVLLEVKTVSTRFWNQLIKSSTVKEYNKQYYSQAILYLLHEQDCEYCIFIFVNKDTDERFYTWVNRQDNEAQDLLARGFDILVSDVIPDKIGGPAHWKCKMCQFYDICHYKDNWQISCRTCQFAEIHNKGEWYCTKHNKNLSFEEQRKACDNFTSLSN